MKELNGVEDAKINFGASKIYVKGETTIEDLEKAGAFDHLKIRGEQEQMAEREPFWKQRENIKVFVSASTFTIELVTQSCHLVRIILFQY